MEICQNRKKVRGKVSCLNYCDSRVQQISKTTHRFSEKGTNADCTPNEADALYVHDFSRPSEQPCRVIAILQRGKQGQRGGVAGPTRMSAGVQSLSGYKVMLYYSLLSSLCSSPFPASGFSQSRIYYIQGLSTDVKSMLCNILNSQ